MSWGKRRHRRLAAVGSHTELWTHRADLDRRCWYHGIRYGLRFQNPMGGCAFGMGEDRTQFSGDGVSCQTWREDMVHLRNLLCAALVAVTLAPMPAFADVVSPDFDDKTWESETDDRLREDEAQKVEEGGKSPEGDGSGCSSAAVGAYADRQATNNFGLAAVVGCLSLTATTGVVCLADKRSQ